MIQMIKGKHGLEKDGKIIGMTKDDGPFETDKDIEKDLVESGFAVEVKTDAKAKADKAPASKKADAVKEEPKREEKEAKK